MHAYGGLYVDLDMQCYRPIDDMLGQSDIVFQEEFKYGGNNQIVNSVIASVPGHPFWQGIVRSQIKVATYQHLCTLPACTGHA